MERWGIIYSPKSGDLHPHKRWEEVRQYLNEKKVDYDFVQSEGSGSEHRLAAMLAKNGYTTIIIVGGDRALNHAVNGIASLDMGLFDTIRLGLIPSGNVNDYASYWGLSEDEPKKAVETLVNGRARKVDLGVVEAGEKKYCFMNCVNVGLAAYIADIRHKTYRFWGLSGLSYVSSIFLLLFQRMEKPMKLTVNHEKIEDKLMTVCIGNSRGYGQTPNAVPYNGMLDVSLISCPAILQLFEGMTLMLRGRILSSRHVRPYRTGQHVLVQDTGNAKISVDGLVMEELMSPFRVHVLKERINFIIPT